MKKLKLFFACLLMAVLSIGQMWGAVGDTYTQITGKLSEGTHEVLIAVGDYNTSNSATSGSSYIASDKTTGTYISLSAVTFGGSAGAYTYVCTDAKQIYTIVVDANGDITSAKSSDNTYFSPSTSSNKLLTDEAGMDVEVSGNCYKWSKTSGSNTYYVCSQYSYNLRAYKGKCGNAKYCCDLILLEKASTPACSNTVSVTKVTPENGDFNISATEVCGDGDGGEVTISNIEPATGYTLDEVSVTVGTYNALTGKVTGITDDTEITVTFKALPKYTVSFNVGGSTGSQADITEASAGAGITLPVGPTPTCSADGWVFAGWAEAAVASETPTAPTLLAAGANYKPATDCTLFAVYKKTEGGDGAAVNTVMWSENFTGVANKTTPASPSENGSEVYGSATITYTWTDGGTTTNVLNDTQGPHTDANNPNVLVSKTNGSLQVSGIPVGKASTLSVEYAKSGQGTLSVSTSTTDVSIDGGTVTIENANVTAFDLTFENTHASKNLRLDDIVVKIASTSAAGTTTYFSAPTCCTPHAITIASPIANGSVTADKASACEGATVTLTFTPALNYHLSAWTLNGEAQDIAENTFTMLDAAVTVSATFAEDACTPLATPVVAVSGKAYPYNAVKLAWSAIEHADAYKVYIYDNEDNELEHNDAVTGVEYTIDQALSASTTYKYSVQAVSNTPATYCPSVAATGSFVTEALPTAHLTLIALGDEHEDTGDYSILTPFNLPSTAASCAKTFMGWDANPECATIPTYAKGAEFTFQNTDPVTLYAVYADETPGAATIKTDELDYEFTGLTGTSYKEWSGKTGTSGAVYAGQSCALGSNPQSTYIQLRTNNSNSGVVTTTTGAGKVTKVTVTWNATQGNDGIKLDVYGKNTAYTQATDLYGDNAGSLLGSIVKGTSTELVISGSYTYLGLRSNNGTVYLDKIDVQWTAQGASTFDNYSTTCVAAPTAEPASASIAVAAAGGEGTLGVSYENVNLAGVEVALFNNEACTEAFDGGWLSASTAGDDKHIAYNAQANPSYNDARTAYIKLTAPETNGAANPAVVVIPVEQAKKPAVFDNLADLVAANIATGTEVTVTFANEVITDDHYISQGTKRAGVLLTTKAANDKAIEIFYNKGETVVPAAWVIGGKLSATAMTFTWTFFSDQWELVPLGTEWTWNNGDLTYTAPKAVSSVVITGAPSKTSYVDGEKFAPAGLTVTVNYTEGEPEVNPVGVTFECTPERVAKSDDPVSVSVVATFNEVSSEAFPVNVNVGDIQLKTVTQFIEAGNADMRCYLEGIVSDIETGTKLKYGNFNLTDASGTIYVYGCLNQAGEAQKFDELDVQNGDKIKVIAEDYDYYNKHEAKNVQFVSKKSPATMTFNDLALEFGEEETMVPASITLADASDIVYSIKEGSDDCVTISGDQITAMSVAGTATIVATLAETDDYVGATAEFAVTVSAPITKYAITFDGDGADGGDAPAAIANQAAGADVPLPANTWTKTNHKFTGWKVINNSTSTEVSYTGNSFTMPASAVTIQAQWEEISDWAYVYSNNVAVTHANSGANGTITIGTDDPYALEKAGSKNNTGTIKVTVPAGATDLHFHAFAWGGQTAKIQISGVTNPSVSEFDLAGEAGASGNGNDFTLQGDPVDQYFHVSFDAVAAETEITFSKATGSADNRFFFYGVNQEGGDFGSYQRSGLAAGNYATICLPNGGTISNNAKLYDLEYFDGDNTLYLLEVNGNAMEAGHPYIFLPSETSIEVTYTNNFNASAGSFNGLVGSYSQVEITKNAGNYILYQNQYWLVNSEAYVGANRAYIHMADVPDAPSQQQSARRRVAMTVNGANAPQGFDNLESGDAPKKVMIEGTLYIIRGEKQYDATGRLVK